MVLGIANVSRLVIVPTLVLKSWPHRKRKKHAPNVDFQQ